MGQVTCVPLPRALSNILVADACLCTFGVPRRHDALYMSQLMTSRNSTNTGQRNATHSDVHDQHAPIGSPSARSLRLLSGRSTQTTSAISIRHASVVGASMPGHPSLLASKRNQVQTPACAHTTGCVVHLREPRTSTNAPRATRGRLRNYLSKTDCSCAEFRDEKMKRRDCTPDCAQAGRE